MNAKVLIVKLIHIASEYELADIFTNVLPWPILDALCDCWGLVSGTRESDGYKYCS